MSTSRRPVDRDPPAGIAIFVKTPGLSPVKSRLWPALGRKPAEVLYRRMAASVAASLRPVLRADLASYWAIAEDHPAARRCWRSLPALLQGDGDLGARMHAVQQALMRKHRSWLLTGADAVLLDARLHLRPALAWLAHPAPRLVLGPAEDGGFWLIGGNLPLPLDLWQAPRYSSANALADLLLRVRDGPTPSEVLQLPVASDLDTVDDLPAVRFGLDLRPALQRAQRRLRRRIRSLG